MRIDAAVSVRSFLDAVDEEDMDPLRPLVPQLLQQFLTLSNEASGCCAAAGTRQRGGSRCGAGAFAAPGGCCCWPPPHDVPVVVIRDYSLIQCGCSWSQIDNEDLTFSLETVIERFAADMAPYATGLCQQLAQQFWRITAAGEGAEGGDDDEDGGDDGALGSAGGGEGREGGREGTRLRGMADCWDTSCLAICAWPSVPATPPPSHATPGLQARWLPTACCAR